LKNSKALLRGLGKLLAADKGNWKVVALCVLGATTFWFFNALNKDYSTRITYPIEFIYQDSGTVVTQELPKRVSMVVSGGGWNLLRKTFWFSATPIQIPLESPTYQKYITKADLSSVIDDQLAELRLNYVVTDTLFLNIERRLTKKVKVKVDSSAISLAQNNRITGPIILKPDSVEFTGPQSFIAGLADSITVYATDENIAGNYKGIVNLGNLTSSVVSVQPAEIQVSFPTGVFLRQTRQVGVRPLNFPQNNSARLRDTLVQLSFTVSQKNLESLPPGSFSVVADYAELNSADSTIALKLGSFPAVAENVVLQPEKIKVRYARRRRR
jgi:hypothetical protein